MQQLELIPRATRLDALKKALDKYGHAVDPLLRLSVEYLIECASDKPVFKVEAKKEKMQEVKPPSHFILLNKFVETHGFPISTIYKQVDNLNSYCKAEVWLKSSHKVWVDEERLLELLSLSDSVRISKRAQRCLDLLRKETAHDQA